MSVGRLSNPTGTDRIPLPIVPTAASTPSGQGAPKVSAQQPPAAAAAAAQSNATEQQRETTRNELQKAVERVRQEVEVRAPNELKFSIDRESGKTIVRIIDARTGELIRQIPPKEMMDIAKSIERMQGLLVHRQA